MFKNTRELIESVRNYSRIEELAEEELDNAEEKIKQIENKAKFADEIIEFCKAGDYTFDMLEAIEMLYTEIFGEREAE